LAHISSFILFYFIFFLLPCIGEIKFISGFPRITVQYGSFDELGWPSLYRSFIPLASLLWISSSGDPVLRVKVGETQGIISPVLRGHRMVTDKLHTQFEKVSFGGL